MPRSRAFAFIVHELKQVLPPTIFFAVGFVLIELTTQLILDEYLVRFANFMVAVGAALVVGKAVLVANMLPFLRRFDHAPLIRPILFKTVVYTLVVAVVRFLERLLEFFWGGGRMGGIAEYATSHFTWHRLLANQIWIFVLFLLYTSVTEFRARLGAGELERMLFTRGRDAGL